MLDFAVKLVITFVIMAAFVIGAIVGASLTETRIVDAIRDTGEYVVVGSDGNSRIIGNIVPHIKE